MNVSQWYPHRLGQMIQGRGQGNWPPVYVETQGQRIQGWGQGNWPPVYVETQGQRIQGWGQGNWPPVYVETQGQRIQGWVQGNWPPVYVETQVHSKVSLYHRCHFQLPVTLPFHAYLIPLLINTICPRTLHQVRRLCWP